MTSRKLLALASSLLASIVLLGGCSLVEQPPEEPAIAWEQVPGRLTVHFRIVGTGCREVEWDFGDGTVLTDACDTFHDYRMPGDYTVIARVEAEEDEGGDEGVGPLSEPLVLYAQVHVRPIEPFSLDGFEVEVIAPPPWWQPHGEYHVPEGAALRFRALWTDYVPQDDLCPYSFQWWAIRIEDSQTFWYGEGEESTCPGLYLGGSSCSGSTTPYRIVLVCHLTDGSIERYEGTIWVEPTS